MPKSFNFTRRQKAGILGLSLLILSLLLYSEFSPASSPGDPFTLDSTDIAYLNTTDFDRNYAQQENQNDDQSAYQEKANEHIVNYFKFDPNTLDSVGFCSLGFSEKQTSSILKYRKNYGPFQTKEDFQKIYVVSEKKYDQLKSYIEIDDIIVRKIELNSASAEDLQKINGIGPKLSARIIGYRNLIGGFVSPDQLNEVWGLEDPLLNDMKKQVSADQEQLKKMNINNVAKEKLEKHPYISFEMMAAIMKERDREKIKSLDFLTNSFPKKEIGKIQPYITFE